MMLRRSQLLMIVGFSCWIVGANSQPTPPPEAKIKVTYIQLNPNNDGFFQANVGLTVINVPNQISFNVTIPHIHSLEEVRDRLKPAIDEFAEQMKHAPVEFDKPLR